jgi:tRNA(Ile)-lysidine synthase
VAPLRSSPCGGEPPPSAALARPLGDASRASFDLDTLGSATEPVLEAALARALRTLAAGELARVHVKALARLVRSGRPGPVALPRGRSAWIERGRLVLDSSEQAPRAESGPQEGALELPVPGRVLDAVSGLVFETRIAATTSPHTSAHVAQLDRSLATGRLAIRRRRPGDRFFPLGASGKTTLKRFFIDRKIPRAERARVPIVTLEDLPIWVVGERIDDRVKVTAATREVLVLSASPVAR